MVDTEPSPGWGRGTRDPLGCSRCKNCLIHHPSGTLGSDGGADNSSASHRSPLGLPQPTGVLGDHSATWGVFLLPRDILPGPPSTPPTSSVRLWVPPPTPQAPLFFVCCPWPPHTPIPSCTSGHLGPLLPTSRPSSTSSTIQHQHQITSLLPQEPSLACAGHPQGPFLPLSAWTTHGHSPPGSWFPDSAAGDDIIGGGYQATSLCSQGSLLCDLKGPANFLKYQSQSTSSPREEKKIQPGSRRWQAPLLCPLTTWDFQEATM